MQIDKADIIIQCASTSKKVRLRPWSIELSLQVERERSLKVKKIITCARLAFILSWLQYSTSSKSAHKKILYKLAAVTSIGFLWKPSC